MGGSLNPLKPKDTLEKELAKELIAYMREQGWYVIKLHGNKFQKGLPDYVAFHKKYGTRWFEMKRPRKGRLTRDQRDVFMKMTAHGAHIFILTGVKDYKLLFGQGNWWLWMDGTPPG